jgi:hypothetical protein
MKTDQALVEVNQALLEFRSFLTDPSGLAQGLGG